MLQGSQLPAITSPDANSTGIDIPYYIDDSAATVSLKMAAAMDQLFAAVNGNTLDNPRSTMEAANAYRHFEGRCGLPVPTETRRFPAARLRLYDHNGVNVSNIGSSTYIGTGGPAGNNAGQPYTPLPFSSTLTGDSNGTFASPLTTTLLADRDSIRDEILPDDIIQRRQPFGCPRAGQRPRRRVHRQHRGGHGRTRRDGHRRLLAATNSKPLRLTPRAAPVPITGDVSFFAVPSRSGLSRFEARADGRLPARHPPGDAVCLVCRRRQHAVYLAHSIVRHQRPPGAGVHARGPGGQPDHRRA